MPAALHACYNNTGSTAPILQHITHLCVWPFGPIGFNHLFGHGICFQIEPEHRRSNVNRCRRCFVSRQTPGATRGGFIKSTAKFDQIQRNRQLMSLRFLIFPLLQMVTLASLLIGGAGLFFGYSTLVLFVIAFDFFSSDNKISVESDNIILFYIPNFSFFIHIIIFIISIIYINELNFDSNSDYFAVLYVTIQLSALNIHNGISNSHELMHRGRSVDFFLAQFLDAFSLHASVPIDHVYGHHRFVGLERDNATARRGETFWAFLPHAVLGANRFAVGFERDRLARKGVGFLSPDNRFLHGIAQSSIIAAAAYFLGGLPGLLAFVAAGLIAVVFIESGNYIGHYGLVREAGKQIAPRHSWNNYNSLSTSMLLNLPRHSDHHLASRKHYWKLEAIENAPCYPLGFITMGMIALVPPLFFRITQAELDRWTSDLATEGERRIVAEIQAV